MSAALAQEARVDVFSPQGEARGVRQVAVRFSAPMVTLGDPRLPDPVAVRCDGDPERTRGHGRWADQKNWVYDFASDLPAGQRCTFTLVADLKSVAGTAVGGRREWSFHTGGPAVLTSLPRDGDESIDDEQAFVLALDAPLQPARAYAPPPPHRHWAMYATPWCWPSSTPRAYWPAPKARKGCWLRAQKAQDSVWCRG